MENVDDRHLRWWLLAREMNQAAREELGDPRLALLADIYRAGFTHSRTVERNRGRVVPLRSEDR